MSELGGLPKLPATCSQCGEAFSALACGPTHAMIWWSIAEPVLYERNRSPHERRRSPASPASQEGAK